MRRFFSGSRKVFIIYIMTAVLTLFFMANVSAQAPTALLSFAEDGYNGTETYIFSPDSDDGETPSSVPLNLSGTRWDYSGDISSENRRVLSDIQTFAAEIMDEYDLIPENADPSEYSDSRLHEFKGYAELSLDYKGRVYDLSDYDSLRFGINISDGAAHYPVHILLETTEGSYKSETYITTDASSSNYSHVFIDLSDVSGELVQLTIRTEYSRGDLPDYIRCTLPYVTTNSTSGFANAERFSTHRLAAETGSVTLTSGTVRPDSNGSAYISAKLAAKSLPAHNSSAYFEVKLSGITQGNLTVSILYAGTTAEQRQYAKKISLSSADGIYTIPIDVYADILSFALQFDNVECDTSFTIDSIRLYSGAAPLISGNSDIGSVSSISRNGSSVTFTGTMERNYVKQFSGESIYFYAISGSTPNDISSAILLGSVKVSTIFESTVDLSDYPTISDTFMFFAAVKNDDSEDEQVLPLSHPRYIDTPAITESQVSNVGLYNAATVGAFESNVSHVIVDVPLDELISSNSSSVASAAYINYRNEKHGGNEAGQLYFDHTLLDSLDRDIEFYNSAGIEVYLKLSSFSAIEGMSHDADAVSTALHKYAAVIRFLSQRYSGTAGIVLGDGVNSAGIVSEDTFSDAAGYASVIAEMCRITYNAASVYIPDIIVAVPFVPDDGSEWISGKSLAVMLSDRLSSIGQIPWAYLYTFRTPDTDLEAVDSMNKLLYDLEIEGSGAAMFLYKPSNDALLADYLKQSGSTDGESIEYNEFVASSFADICDLCSSYKARAVFLSLDGMSIRNDHDFYSALKNAGQSDRFVYDSFASSDVSHENYASHITLWDFTDQYYSLGWIAGGGVSSCSTVSVKRFLDDPENGYGRVLRSTFETADSIGVAGIIMRNFNEKYDLSRVDSIDFTFSLEMVDSDEGYISLSPDEEGVTVVFVIGTDDYRAEYYADSLKCGEVQRYSCDLTEYEYRNNVDYVGIMVYSDYEVSLDLSSVGAASMTLGEDELTEMFSSLEESEDESDMVSLAVFIVIIAVMTVSTVILLNRRDREEEELREAERRSDPKNRRNSRELSSAQARQYTRRQ